MQCPGCGLYHPARYDQCVSCGRKLNESAAPQDEEPAVSNYQDEAEPEQEDDDEPRARRRKTQSSQKGLSKGLGLTIAAGILLASAGGTYFFLSRPPESDRLLSEGQKQLANGQFAFAQKTLEQAMAIKPSDPKILLSLARAYVGTDQVEKAWTCISQAQQSGSGVMSDPQLSSDLAKYYVQRNQYARAAELLRPLAQQNVPHKKTELSDLDALWGDDCFNKGDTTQALKCWEEIKNLAEGSRFNEADTRLATIYQKMSNELLAKDDVDGALNCLNNLNTIAPSPQTFEKVADLYAKQAKLDLAIDQLRRAIKLGNGSKELNRKLAGLLSRRGKELLDSGDTETGYAYLQQAQGFDNGMKLPSVALRSINVAVDSLSGQLRASGEAWNPGPNQVSGLTVRAELFDTQSSQAIWSKEQKLVDEFVPPLQAKESKAFDLSGPMPNQEGLEMRIYLDGSLYKSYPLKSQSPANSAPHLAPPINRGPEPSPQPVPPIQATPNPTPGAPTQPGLTPEERTLRDLE
ncbi:MAG: tetratricopeptide repeat protein [Candidatus Obscuribacterales bacterium]|nr:tetratricopeptide repeat protein [Candidatus Obscuribacterales bacterium]